MNVFRKAPTLTPALLAAYRCNAQKSTGLRTAAGKAWVRLNDLRTGSRSRFCQTLWRALAEAGLCTVWYGAEPFQIGEVARSILMLTQG
jgi:hypothetical protein